MFVGHFALGLMARRATPRGGLAAFFAAAQWPDLLWPALLATGVEHVTIAPGDTPFTPLRFDAYPISHSLLLDLAWGALFALAVYGITRHARTALVCAGLVVSHWVLDFVSHRPDMPLLPGGGPRLGLGLWGSPAATIAVEMLLLGAGVLAYLRATTPAAPNARLRLGVLVGMLLVSYLAAAFGPPPPSVVAIEVAGVLGFALALGLALWVDRGHVPA